MFSLSASRRLRGDHEAPILKIFVPQTGQVPCVAGRPFFIVIAFASLISREALHFTQYPVATGSPPRAILNADAFSGTHPF
jgi:hypothetical protein